MMWGSADRETVLVDASQIVQKPESWPSNVSAAHCVVECMNEQSAEAKFRILVVEDNPGDVYLLRLALQHARVSYELTVVEDGEKALTLIHGYDDAHQACNVHLAVLTCNFPSNTEWELLKP